MSVLASARSTDGRLLDVTVEGGVITRVEPSGPTQPAGSTDLDGRLLLPAMGEPHAHLDKAFTADVFLNPAGDLAGAVEAIRAGWLVTSTEDIVERAERAVRRLVAAGTTLIRSHADVVPEGEQKSVEALLEVRRRTSHLCDLELVALAMPLTGDDGPATLRRIGRAVEEGVDVVGACPHLEEDPVRTIRLALALAAETGSPVDLHFDEVLDPEVQHLPELARQVEALGLGGRVTASHCVSHGLLPADRQREVGHMLADAGVAVVTNPRTNLYLQARGILQAPPRGLAGVRALLDAGTVVAAGADNVQDPFYIVGRSDPLETASLLVSVAHLSIEEAWTLVSAAVRRLARRPPVQIAVGSPADFVAVAAASLRQAIADQPADRIVFHRGVMVSRTTVDSWIADREG